MSLIYLLPSDNNALTLPQSSYSFSMNIDYSLAEYDNRIFIIADDLISDVQKKLKKEFNIILTITDDLLDVRAEHPFYDKTIPIIEAEHVTTENGTGLVHIAPGHGQDDYIVGLDNNLEIFNPVDDKGVFKKSLELFGGIHVRKANEPIIKKPFLTMIDCFIKKSIHIVILIGWRFKNTINL